MIANAGIGGDSAVRGMVVGMFLGAIKGRAGIPGRWIEVVFTNQTHADTSYPTTSHTFLALHPYNLHTLTPPAANPTLRANLTPLIT